MRIHSEATSYIAAPRPKDDPFRGGPSPMKSKSKSKSKSKLFNMLSVPIRKIGKKMSRRSGKTSGDKNKLKRASEHLNHRDAEQGWLAPASTFETEECMSPRSVGTLLTGDSNTLLSQIQQEEEDEELAVSGTLRQLLPDQYLNLQAPIHEQIEPIAISPMTSIVQGCDSPRDTACTGNMQGDPTTHQIHDVEVATIGEVPDQYLDLQAPVHERIEPSAISPMKSIVQGCNSPRDTACTVYMEGNPTTHQIHDVDISMIGEDIMVSEDIESPMSPDSDIILSEDIVSIASSDNDEMLPEDIASPMSSMASQQDRINFMLEEDEEIDSMTPAVDFSLFLEEEDIDDEFLCVGHLSTPRQPSATPPTEIDVENENDLSTNSSEFSHHEQHDQEDSISTTSSYNSYLQAIKSITASANSEVERAMTMVTDNIQIEELAYEPEIEGEEDVDDDKSYRVSFNPSNELLLQAMEGASLRAKIDIEQATALALSKIITVTSKSYQEAAAKRARARAQRSSNRVLGFSFLLFLFFSLNGNSFFQYISSSVGVDDFQMPQSNGILVKGHSDLTLWAENSVAPLSIQDTSFEISRQNENAHNVACVFKVGCLALGSI